MTKNTRDVDADLTINQNELDVEWLKQANLMYRYGEESATAKNRMETAKERLDTIIAEVKFSVRSNPLKHGFEKATEGLVDSVTAMDKRVKEATNQLNQVRHEFDLIQAALRALEAKRSALEHLVKLLQMNYFASPKEPRRVEHVVPRPTPNPTFTQQATRNVIRRRLNPHE